MKAIVGTQGRRPWTGGNGDGRRKRAGPGAVAVHGPMHNSRCTTVNARRTITNTGMGGAATGAVSRRRTARRRRAGAVSRAAWADGSGGAPSGWREGAKDGGRGWGTFPRQGRSAWGCFGQGCVFVNPKSRRVVVENRGRGTGWLEKRSSKIAAHYGCFGADWVPVRQADWSNLEPMDLLSIDWVLPAPVIRRHRSCGGAPVGRRGDGKIRHSADGGG